MSSTNGYWKEIFFLHFLHFAKINKCKRLNMLGRPGWKEFVKKHGWKVKHYQYQKEIN